MPILDLYLVRRFMLWLLILAVVFGGLIFMADFVEMLRFSNKIGTGAISALYYTGLRFPFQILGFMPFIFLFGTIFCMLRLSESHELIAVRVAGISIWRLLVPFVVTAAMLGILIVIGLTPIGAEGFARFKELKQARGAAKQKITLSDSGVWFRDKTIDGRFILQARQMSDQEQKILRDIRILKFNTDGSFAYQLLAEQGQLADGIWRLKNVQQIKIDEPIFSMPTFELPTRLTRNTFEQNFRDPQAMSLGQLGDYIRLGEKTGIDVISHKARYNSLIALPCLLITMVLLAACFSLPTGRLYSATRTFGFTTLTGTGLFLGSKFFDLLSKQGLLAPVPAAWAAPVIAMLLAISLLLQLEDG